MVGVNIMRYTIELCKVGIVEAGILRVEQRKRGFFLYLISILVVSITTMVGWDQSLVIFFSILLTLGLSMKTCKKIWLIPTIYVSVSLLDVIHSLVMIRFVGLSYEQMQENLLVSTGINCITLIEASVYKGYKRDKIEMRGDRAEISDFPLYLNTVAGGLDRRDQTIGGFSFVVKIYALPVVEIIGQLLYLLGRYGFNTQFGDCF